MIPNNWTRRKSLQPGQLFECTCHTVFVADDGVETLLGDKRFFFCSDKCQDKFLHNPSWWEFLARINFVPIVKASLVMMIFTSGLGIGSFVKIISHEREMIEAKMDSFLLGKQAGWVHGMEICFGKDKKKWRK